MPTVDIFGRLGALNFTEVAKHNLLVPFQHENGVLEKFEDHFIVAIMQRCHTNVPSDFV